MIIPLQEIPEEGIWLDGQLPPSFLDLPKDDPVQPISPITYEIFVERDGDAVLAQGSCATKFRHLCCRCGQPFEDIWEKNDWHAAFPLEKDQTSVDLGAILREDIVLDLPGYPRCDESSLNPRVCPANDLLKPEASSGKSPQSEPEIDLTPKPDPWNALDNLDLPGEP